MKTTNLKNLSKALLLLLFFGLSSCDTLLKTAGTLIDQNVPLSSADIATGLKQALEVSVDTAVYRLNKLDGYYRDAAVKLMLPPETNQVLEYARKVPGLDRKIEDFILQINRSAEDAAAQAAPIFKNAITSMKIDDAVTILHGSENAATQYLRDKTYAQLADLYRPVLAASLKKPLAAGISADQTWKEITGQWNKFATSFAGDLLKLEPVNIQLDEYFTSKALDGVFVKVELQEKEIRNNANARVTNLLQRIFEK